MNRHFNVISGLLTCAVLFCGATLGSRQAYAQAGLRESLERLDRNENGSIDPHEITPLARPYLERVAKSHRMSLDRSNEIERWQEAARVYYALSNGVSDQRVSPEGESTVKAFGPLPGEPLVPEFGLAEMKYPYTQDDLDFADRTMGSHDRNKDGYIDREEAAKEKWTHRNPFDDDLNKDDRLSRLELAQRYARRRLLEGASGELAQRSKRVGSGVRSSRERDDDRRDDSQWSRRGGSRYYLTATVLGRFDLNKNGRLELEEASSLGIPTGRIDADRDGELSREELYAFFSELQDEAGDLADGLPGWFYELDANRDEQVAMSEFTSEWSEDKLQEFTALDTNGDGLLTTFEVTQSKAMVGGTYSNRNAEVLPPRKTIISEIDVREDYLIGDLNIQFSITHSHTSDLDAYLTGPNGQRVELFSGVGGSDDHFDQTILDDQSRFPITKARPPFKGTFMPEALVKRQPSLSQFTGQSVKGVWQLVVRGTRSERFGMLHHWGLIVKPQENMLEAVAPPPEQDGPQESGIPSRPAIGRAADDSSVDSGRARDPRFQDPKVQDSRVQDPKVQAEIESRELDSEFRKPDTSAQEDAARFEARQKVLEKYREYLEKQKSKDGKKRADEKFPGKKFPYQQ